MAPIRLVLSVLASLSVLALAVAAESTPAAARSSCAQRVIHDWADGRIDGSYPLPCYRRALRQLPADLLVYSSAPDDIRQALSQQVATRHARTLSSRRSSRPVVRRAEEPHALGAAGASAPVQLIVLAVVAGALVAGAVGFSVRRFRWRRPAGLRHESGAEL